MHEWAEKEVLPPFRPPYLDLTEKLFLSVDEWFLAQSGVL